MRRYRSNYRTRGSRRTSFRRTYRTTRVQRSRRLFRRFIRRAALKPELKWAISDSNGSLLSNASFTTTASVTALGQGTSSTTRIGSSVRFVKVDVTIMLKNDSSTVLAAPEIQSAPTRVVIWSPRVDIQSAGTYMTSLGYLTHIDFSQVTVYRDFLVNLSPPYMREVAQNDIAGGPYAFEVVKKMSIKFPRKVKFAQSNNALDEEKYRLYVTFYTSSLATAVYCTNKTWFIDN